MLKGNLSAQTKDIKSRTQKGKYIEDIKQQVSQQAVIGRLQDGSFHRNSENLSTKT